MTLDLKYSLVNSFICFQVSSSNSLLLSRILFSELNFWREGFPWWPIVRKWNWMFCVVLWRHYHAPVFWILWKLRFWSCASLSFIRTKVVWYICSQSGTFKAIFRYYETSYNLHKSRDQNSTWVTDFEKHQIVADRSRLKQIVSRRESETEPERNKDITWRKYKSI